MRSDLQIIRIPEHTPEWYEFRKNGIGGSEIGTILGLNKYDTVVRTFHEKVGTVAMRHDDNQAMFWGRELEDKIAEIWKYYDGTKDGYIENRKNNRIVRECRSINGYIVNPRYPWLFGSLDRVMNIKGGINMITSQALTTEAVLECKGLSYWASQMWQDGIPIYYLAQIHLYMIILETDYAEIAILQDGNQFRVETYQRDEELCESIINISRAFWENRVLPAKAAYEKKQLAEISGNIHEVEKYEALIQKYEPDPDMSESYKDFMEERFLKERDVIDGNMDHYVLCKRYTLLNKLTARLAKEKVGIRNILLKTLGKYGVDAIDFGKLGNITWSERKGRKKRTFTIRIREYPSEDRIDTEFLKINQYYD